MKKNLTQRVIIIAVVTIASLYVVIGPRRKPALKDFTWGGIKQTLADNIHLGLDLKGGSHLVMQVKTQEYLKRLTENTARGVEGAAKAGGYAVQDTKWNTDNGNYSFTLNLSDASKGTEVRDAMPKKVDLNEWTSAVSGNAVTWTLTTQAQRTLSDQAVDQALKIIDSRINAVGVAEPTLQRHGAQGSHQILLQMPGIQDPERVKQLLVAESKLDLVHVVGPASPQPVQTFNSEAEAMQSLGGTVPSNRHIYPYAERDEPTSSAGQAANKNDPNKPKKWVIVENPPVVDGSELRSADAIANDATGRSGYKISFQLKPTGADRFGQWTGQNINQYMGIVLNGEVKSIAYIKSQITDSGQIDGRFTKESADDLALTLRSGALPAPLQYLEERTVGPSLGADSIRSGVKASVYGLLFVIAFMLFYYRGAGVNAVVALLLNMLLMIAGLVIFGATLTLPGIAGIILTIGMAVDSNVLIFERIREEVDSGKTVASAVDQGFARAFVTIIDTHVTTIISSLFLFIFGTGPIRGFAVTLVLGLIVNLFSAVYVSRTIFMWLLNRRGRRAETISI